VRLGVACRGIDAGRQLSVDDGVDGSHYAIGKQIKGGIMSDGTVRRYQRSSLDVTDADCDSEWVKASDYDALRTQARELAEELRKLANEASGFEAMSSDAHHGYTNKLILRARVEEARAVLAKAQAVLKEGA